MFCFLQIRTRTGDLSTRRDQPGHTRARVQDRGRRRTDTGGRPRAVPGARHQDDRVPGREARAVPGGQAVRGARREEGARARRQAVPRARVQDQAHLPRAQMGQMVQQLVNNACRARTTSGGKTIHIGYNVIVRTFTEQNVKRIRSHVKHFKFVSPRELPFCFRIVEKKNTWKKRVPTVIRA